MDEGNGMAIVVPGIVAVVVVESVVVAVVVERNVGEEVRRRVGERTGCVRVYLYVRIGHRLREAASESENIFAEKRYSGCTEMPPAGIPGVSSVAVQFENNFSMSLHPRTCLLPSQG